MSGLANVLSLTVDSESGLACDLALMGKIACIDVSANDWDCLESLVGDRNTPKVDHTD